MKPEHIALVEGEIEDLIARAAAQGIETSALAGMLAGAAYGLVAEEEGPKIASAWLMLLAARAPRQLRKLAS